jgi:hypothetical protein
MNKLLTILFLLAGSLLPAFLGAQVNLQFNNMANGKSLVLQDSAYQNAFGEDYQLTRLRYYLSNVQLLGAKPSAISNVFLVDAAAPEPVVLQLKPGVYKSLQFTLGVDSALNCSGAQAGALDPMKGMFWTWNTGYIYFKMEGYSAASTADLQRIEYHIGGYRSPYIAARNISLQLPQPLRVKAGEQYNISIAANLDRFWQGATDLHIAQQALLMQPGKEAFQLADNIAGMFTVQAVEVIKN